jgi:hypothetical protein
MTKKPELLGKTELWSGRLHFRSGQKDVHQIQDAVTEYVTESGITVVGYYAKYQKSLTLWRWPETRTGYRCPEIDECNIALSVLAERLKTGGTKPDVKLGVIPRYKVQAFLGLRRDGYDGESIARLGEIAHRLGGYGVIDAYMVSARTCETPEGTKVLPYGEPGFAISVSPLKEDIIHRVGYALRQHHYAIAHGPTDEAAGKTELWQTSWASERS